MKKKIKMKNNCKNRKLLKIRVRNCARRFKLKPLVAIKINDLTTPEIEKFKKQWQEAMCGVKNTGKILSVPQEAKIEFITIKKKDG